jgi:hypothetical protein
VFDTESKLIVRNGDNQEERRAVLLAEIYKFSEETAVLARNSALFIRLDCEGGAADAGQGTAQSSAAGGTWVRAHMTASKDLASKSVVHAVGSCIKLKNETAALPMKMRARVLLHELNHTRNDTAHTEPNELSWWPVVASGQVVSLQPKGPKTGVVNYNTYVRKDLKLDLQGQQHFTTWSEIRQSLPKESSTTCCSSKVIQTAMQTTWFIISIAKNLLACTHVAKRALFFTYALIASIEPAAST